MNIELRIAATDPKAARPTDLRRRTTHDKRVQRLVCQRAQRSGSVVCGLSASAAKRVWSEAQPSESYSPQPLPPLIDVIVLVSA